LARDRSAFWKSRFVSSLGNMKFAAALAIFAASFRQSLAGVNLIDDPNRQFKVHFPDTTQSSCDAILFSVGTAVAVHGYDTMSQGLVQKGFIVVVVDPEKGSMTKLDVAKLKTAYIQAKLNLYTWSSQACDSINNYIVGGHSAGGGTAHKVFDEDPSVADAIFSVDSFTRGNIGGVVNLPSLHWGFDVTTCFVDREAGAAAYYDLTSQNKRVFYRAAKVMDTGLCGVVARYYHCAIVDGGCRACRNCLDTPDYFFEDIVNSVDAFAKALAGTWSKDAVTVETTTPVDIFEGSDSWQ